VTNKTPSGAKTPCKVLNKKVTKQPKCFPSQYFFLRQASLKLLHFAWLTVFPQTATFYAEQCTLFHKCDRIWEKGALRAKR